jgi:hypothetical protein
LALKQLLHAQQQELLSDQQPFERHQHHRLQNNRKHSQKKKKAVRVIQGLHSDDDQDSTISRLMEALPDKMLNSIHVHKDVCLNDGGDDVEQLQHGEIEEFEEDVEDLIEERDTP